MFCAKTGSGSGANSVPICEDLASSTGECAVVFGLSRCQLDGLFGSQAGFGKPTEFPQDDAPIEQGRREVRFNRDRLVVACQRLLAPTREPQNVTAMVYRLG